MNDSPRAVPSWAIMAGCLAVAVLCLCPLAAGGYYYLLRPVSSTTAGNEPTVAVSTVSAGPTMTVAVVASPTPPANTPATDPPPADPPTEAAPATAVPADADDPNAAIRDQIEENVIEIRGLSPREPIVPTLLTQEELRQRVESDFFEDYGPEQGRLDALTLSAFDFMERDFDLYNLTLDLYSEQIAGFYDPETAEFVVVSESGRLDPLEQWTHAHELTHALQDQYFELELLSDESIDSEASAGLQALAEGDATLVQLLYISEGYFTQEEMLQLLEAAGAIESPVLDSAPPIIAHDLEFPYVSGLAFAQALYDQGGFAAVNAAWENLPQSTEHILHPERYLAGDAPQLVSLVPLTDTLGAGWQWLDDDTFGEFYLREYLSQRLPEGEVETAATGWGGDYYAVHWNEEQQHLVMVLRSAWDTAADAGEFVAAYSRYAELRQGAAAQPQPDGGRCWQAAEVLCLYQQGEQTLIILAPDISTASTLYAAQSQ